MTKAKDPAATGDQNPAAPAAGAHNPPPAKIKARVLVAGSWGNVNDVVEIPGGTVSSELDAHPDAVAYAESLGQRKS